MFLIHIQLSKQGKRFALVASVVIKGSINLPVSIFISVAKKTYESHLHYKHMWVLTTLTAFKYRQPAVAC